MFNKKVLISGKQSLAIASLAVLAVLSLSGFVTFADTNPNLPVIRIVVFSPSGSPIQGANVYTSLFGNISVGYQFAKTNAQGRASFNIANDTLYQFLINGTSYPTITGYYNFTQLGNYAVIEYVTSNACHTDYTLKLPLPNYTVTLKQTSCA